MITSSHAVVRAKQRGIPRGIDLLLDQFGEEEYDGHGGVCRFFSRTSRRAMERELGSPFVRKIAEYFDAYKIESSHDGKIITTGHRVKRVRRR